MVVVAEAIPSCLFGVGSAGYQIYVLHTDLTAPYVPQAITTMRDKGMCYVTNESYL